MPDRFARVQGSLYRGGRPSDNDLHTLKEKYGVNTIVSLDGDVAAKIHPTCNLLKLEHIVIPIGGDDHYVGIDKLKNNIEDLLKDNTYVHCYHGKDRTGMACAMYRIQSGMDITDALVEAQKFGMGSGLSPSIKKMYYDSVLDFAKLQGDSNLSDAVEMTRDKTNMDNIVPGALNYEISSPNQMSFAPLSPVMNTLASQRVYCFCSSNEVLQPKTWAPRVEVLKYLQSGNTVDGSKRLYSADIDSSSKTVSFRRPINKMDINIARLDDADAALFSGYMVFILNPSALVNIREEDSDSNRVGDGALNIGLYTNYDGLSQNSFPGSSGKMERGYGEGIGGGGGFSGFVQPPSTDF